MFDMCSVAKYSQKAPVHFWEPAKNNWEQIHIDYAEYEGVHYLICVDAKSKWIEVRHSQSAPTSQSTITYLQSIFATHGYPEICVSDNASIFTSEEFTKFCREHGIWQKFIAPGYAATNGLAERNVQTFKRRLKGIRYQPGRIEEKVNAILLRYRATPLACGKTPAELYLGRNIRLRLDAIKPKEPTCNSEQSRVGLRIFSVGDRIQLRRPGQWLLGRVIKVLRTRHYLICLDTGRTVKAHVDQLRKNRIQQVKFALPETSNPIKGIPQQLVPVVPTTTTPTPATLPTLPSAVSPGAATSTGARAPPFSAIQITP